MSEFDYRIHDVVGIAKRRYDSSPHADIYIIGYIYDGTHCKIFNETEIETYFKPHGRVFGHKFRENLLNKLICLHIEEDENKEESARDWFRAYYDSTHPFVYGTTINNIDKFKPLYEAIKSCTTNEYYQNSNEIYYFDRSDTIRGIVKTWQINDDFFSRNNDICRHRDDIYIIGEDITDKKYYYSEIYNNENILKYVIAVIKKHNISPENINTISDDLIKFLNIPSEILKHRFEIFNNMLNTMILTHQSILDLASNPILADVLQRSIKENEDEYIQTYEDHNRDIIDKITKSKKEKIKENEAEYLKLENEHKVKVDLINEEIKTQKTKLKQVIGKIKTREEEAEFIELRFQDIEKHKNRLIEDFSIVSDVIGGRNQNTDSVVALQRTIETINCNGEQISEYFDFKKYLESHLSRNNLSTEIATAIIRLFIAKNEALKNMSVIMFPNIKLIKAFIDAIGQYELLSLSVGVNWKSFDDLYFNGLRDMIISAKDNPDKIHILILQNMNLSYIPSYMQPINDILVGISNTLPGNHGIIGIPSNLWIFGTRTPMGEEAIPISKEAIKEYGCIEYKDYFVESDEECDEENKYITMVFVTTQREERYRYTSAPDSYLD